MDLVIVESPTKARTLNKFLPTKDFVVEATVGHMRDLPKSKLGVDVDKNFKPDWEIVKGKQTVIRKIKKAGQKAKRILLASDPDREGEAIAWHTYELLKKDKKFTLSKKQVIRITFHEITKTAILEAIAHGGKLNKNLFNAQQARRIVDRLVGYKLSPVLWRKIRRGLSAGRVQSVAVRLIVEKEREREAFKPEEYWELVAELQVPKLKPKKTDLATFFSSLKTKNGNKIEISNEKQAMEILADLDIAKYSVKDIQKKETKRNPSPPFTTSTLQQSAVQKLGWSAKNTMRTAQQLYEKGLITYHRTDSLNVSEQAIKFVRSFISKEYGDNYLSLEIRKYKTRAKVAQEAHEAIRPTEISKIPGENGLTGTELSLYKLIWRRFVATQMTSAIYDKTKIYINALIEEKKHSSKLETLNYGLITEGKIRKFDGWLKIYDRMANDDELPLIEQDEDLQLVEVTGAQQFTEPPARYSEATLIKKLEELGIGRPSTYAPTISTIQDRGYVEKDKNRLMPTAVGLTTNDFLVKHFPAQLEYQFTAKMEDSLDDIANGEKEWEPVVKEFYSPFIKTVDKALKADRVKVPTEATGEKCPDCIALHKKGEIKKTEIGEIVIRTGKFGKFLSCSRFPDCKYTAKYLEKIGVKCPDCGDKEGGEVIIKKSKKRRRIFFGCSRWPDCKWVSWNDPRKEKQT